MAVVAAGDKAAGDRVDDSPGDAGVGHAEVAWVLVEESRNCEDSEELTGGILEETDADGFAEALHARTIGGVGIDRDGDGGDAEDGSDVGGVCEVVDGEITFLLPGHRDDDVAAEETLIGIDEFDAGFWHLIVAVWVVIDGLHCAEEAAVAVVFA